MLAGILLGLLTVASAAIVHHFFLLDLQPPGGAKVPAVRGWIPYIGCALDFVANPRLFFEGLRRKHGDTFAIYVFGVRMLCTFSPEGVSSLYHMREKDASFTQATKGLLSLKLPAEVLEENSLNKFHRGLRPRLLPYYVRYARDAIDSGLADMSDEGEFSLFPQIKSLVHRVGMACWVGPMATQPAYFQRLVDAYEQLDPEGGFANLSTLAETQLTGKRKEKRALDALTDVVTEMKLAFDANADKIEELSDDPEDDGIYENLSNMYALHKDEPPQQQHRRVAIDIYHFILASQANMYAGISWCLVHLMTADSIHMEKVMAEIARVNDKYGGANEYLTDLAALDELVYLEAVIYETLRVVQQSITLRKVMGPCELATERGAVRLTQPWYVATILSVTNLDKKHLATVPDLAEFRPARYLVDNESRVELKLPGDLPPGAETLISTFGHFSHACPGRRFAVAISKMCVARLLTELELTPSFKRAVIPPSSVGALARVAGDCNVAFRKRN